MSRFWRVLTSTSMLTVSLMMMSDDMAVTLAYFCIQFYANLSALRVMHLHGWLNHTLCQLRILVSIIPVVYTVQSRLFVSRLFVCLDYSYNFHFHGTALYDFSAMRSRLFVSQMHRPNSVVQRTALAPRRRSMTVLSRFALYMQQRVRCSTFLSRILSRCARNLRQSRLGWWGVWPSYYVHDLLEEVSENEFNAFKVHVFCAYTC
jgi:hypothetical protein